MFLLLQRMKISILATLIFTILCQSISAQDLARDYVDKYKWCAVTEMNRTGVPASIKLAQGILESGKGQSTLATNSKNHFGIKCKESWEGKTYYHNDDDYDKKGNLIKSCFRVYDVVEDSYYDHSEFLKNRPYYTHLFDLEQTDYLNWAKGLREAQYASLKTYDKALIGIIQRYELYHLDTITDLTYRVPVRSDITFATSSPMVSREEFYSNQKLVDLYQNQLFPATTSNSINTVPIIQANTYGILAKDFSDKNNLDWGKISSYNSWTENTILTPFEYCYLKKKKSKLKDSNTIPKNTWISYNSKNGYTHRLAKGQSLKYISNLYGIDLSKLLKLNNLKQVSNLVVGTSVYLTKKRKDKPAINNSNLEPQKNNLLLYDISQYTSQPYLRKKREYTEIYHTVVESESLWKLSKKYKVSIVSIKKDNGLTSDALEKGMILKIKTIKR